MIAGWDGPGTSPRLRYDGFYSMGKLLFPWLWIAVIDHGLREGGRSARQCRQPIRSELRPYETLSPVEGIPYDVTDVLP